MSRDEMVKSLNNVLFTLESVCAQGENNWNALLASKQKIREIKKVLEEEKHDDQDE